MKRSSYALVAACLAGCAAAAPAAGLKRADECGDFLAMMGRKPAALVYAGCVHQADRQGKPLTATYRMEGRAAEAIEDELGRWFGMERLRWICCGWEAPSRDVIDRAGHHYLIMMTSGDTTRNRRADWGLIGSFELRVETLTEEI